MRSVGIKSECDQRFSFKDKGEELWGYTIGLWQQKHFFSKSVSFDLP